MFSLVRIQLVLKHLKFVESFIIDDDDEKEESKTIQVT